MRRVKIENGVGKMFSGTAALGNSCRPNAQAYQGGRQIGWFGRTDCYLRRVGDLPENAQPDHLRSLENALTQSLGRWLLLLNYKHSRGGRGLKVKVCLRPTGLGPKAKLSAVLLGRENSAIGRHVGCFSVPAGETQLRGTPCESARRIAGLLRFELREPDRANDTAARGITIPAHDH